jgi:hypothetical protein
MYAMSWERDTRNEKYESIQHGYSVIDDYEEDELTKDLSLDELMEDGFDLGFEEEMEME